MIMKLIITREAKYWTQKKSDNAIMSAAHANRSISSYPLRNQM